MPEFSSREPAEVVLKFLADALNEIDVGILLLDPDMRARFVNRRQTEIFALSPELLASRPTYRDLMTHCIANCLIQVPETEVAEFIDQRDAEVHAGSTAPVHLDFRDGTRVLFSCTVCPDGGRILTYADVSRELRREAFDAIEHINAELRFNTETMEDHAAQMASLAEQSDESIRGVEAARRALEHEIAERRVLEARLREMATTDGLTGALNRLGFLAKSQEELERTGRAPQGLTILMIDVDHFKTINDRYGHAGGDLALKHLVTSLRAGIRRGDLLGRLGGEEFAILLTAIPPDKAERLAKRLLAQIARTPLIHNDEPIAMTISVGVAVATAADRSIDQIIMRADDALYRAKRSGRNRVVTEQRSAAV